MEQIDLDDNEEESEKHMDAVNCLEAQIISVEPSDAYFYHEEDSKEDDHNANHFAPVEAGNKQQAKRDKEENEEKSMIAKTTTAIESTNDFNNSKHAEQSQLNSSQELDPVKHTIRNSSSAWYATHAKAASPECHSEDRYQEHSNNDFVDKDDERSRKKKNERNYSVYQVHENPDEGRLESYQALYDSRGAVIGTGCNVDETVQEETIHEAACEEYHTTKDCVKPKQIAKSKILEDEGRKTMTAAYNTKNTTVASRKRFGNPNSFGYEAFNVHEKGNDLKAAGQDTSAYKSSKVPPYGQKKVLHSDYLHPTAENFEQHFSHDSDGNNRKCTDSKRIDYQNTESISAETCLREQNISGKEKKEQNIDKNSNKFLYYILQQTSELESNEEDNNLEQRGSKGKSESVETNANGGYDYDQNHLSDDNTDCREGDNLTANDQQQFPVLYRPQPEMTSSNSKSAEDEQDYEKRRKPKMLLFTETSGSADGYSNMRYSNTQYEKEDEEKNPTQPMEKNQQHEFYFGGTVGDEKGNHRYYFASEKSGEVYRAI